MEQR
jgi:hypothetical protein